MGSRGSSSRSKAYRFDGLKSNNENILAAFESVRNIGKGSRAEKLETFKDLVDGYRRGQDGVNIKTAIEYAIDEYKDYTKE